MEGGRGCGCGSLILCMFRGEDVNFVWDKNGDGNYDVGWLTDDVRPLVCWMVVMEMYGARATS